MQFTTVRCSKPSTQTCIFQRNPKSTKTNFFQNLLKPNKTENTHFINKIVCLLKLLNFLFTYLNSPSLSLIIKFMVLIQLLCHFLTIYHKINQLFVKTSKVNVSSASYLSTLRFLQSETSCEVILFLIIQFCFGLQQMFKVSKNVYYGHFEESHLLHIIIVIIRFVSAPRLNLIPNMFAIPLHFHTSSSIVR